jgi:succinate dehydrogenase / fumarate reductase membrane anchor subunit
LDEKKGRQGFRVAKNHGSGSHGVFGSGLGFFLVNGAIDYNSFIEFFGNPAMKIASSVAVLATIGHAWVGLWTIGTDYIQPGHWGLPDYADKIRLGYQFGCVAIMGVYLASALWAIW